MGIKILDNSPYEGRFRGTEQNYFAVKVCITEQEFRLMKSFEKELDIKMTDQIGYVLNGLFTIRETKCSASTTAKVLLLFLFIITKGS